MDSWIAPETRRKPLKILLFLGIRPPLYFIVYTRRYGLPILRASSFTSLSPFFSVVPMSYPPEVNNGTTTSWLPLTTTYVAPASCTSFFYAPAAVVAVNDYVYINDPNDAVSMSFSCLLYPTSHFNVFLHKLLVAQNALLPTPCLPDIVTLWWDQDKASVTNVVTSIGPLVCPAGYEVVWSRDDQGRNANSALTACCPRSASVSYFSSSSSPI